VTLVRLAPVRVAIVDDDAALLRRLTEWFAARTYDVVGFATLAEVAEHRQRAPVPVVIADLQLPDQRPAEILATLRRCAERSRLIALAALPDVALALAALRGGACDVLEKPVAEPALMSAVERQLLEMGLVSPSEADLNLNLGRRLSRRRAELGRTQADVAATAGLSAAQLSAIESGKSAAPLWTLARICAALEMPLRRLFEE
jgi:two-component system response regulator FixJ